MNINPDLLNDGLSNAISTETLLACFGKVALARQPNRSFKHSFPQMKASGMFDFREIPVL
jgi:hypothetical protein